MAEHHLPPEDGHGKDGKGVHAGDLKPASRGRRYYYGGGGDGGGGGGVRALCFAVLVLLLAVGITFLVLYVVYRPATPSLAVNSAAVLALYNATPTATPTPTPGAMAAGGMIPAGPTAVAASFQFALVLRNPSGRSAARYDRLAAYAAYRGEAITPPSPLPPLAQEAGSAVTVAPVLGVGAMPGVPVSPDAAAALAADAAAGVLPLRVVVLGRVRFVSGPFRRGWRSMYARCDVLVGVRGGRPGSNEAPLLGDPVCNVDI